MNETPVQQRVRLEAARMGLHMWRNNSGACYDDGGRLIRYGLGNDSEQINKIIKSSDLIGLCPVTVTQSMVGKVFGIFTAFEVKKSDWTGRKLNEREIAQLNYIDLVRNAGGIAGFVNEPMQIHSLIMERFR